MRHLKKSCLAILLLSSMASTSYAAQELTPQKADSLQSFKEVSVRGQYYSESDYARAISKIADKESAAYFYITSANVYPGNDSLRVVYAKLYKADAQEVIDKPEDFRKFAGVYEYPKTKAIRFEPYDIIRIRGYFPTQHELNTAVGKEAASKGAYAYYIDRAVEFGSNVQITAYLFKQDATERKLQPEDAIPYDSEAGQQALAMGGEAAMQVERPGYYSPSTFNEQFYVEKFKNDAVKEVNTTADATDNTQTKVAETSSKATTEATQPAPIVMPSQKSSRYTVTLPDGTKIEELNDATAAKMVPFDTIKFRGYFVTEQEISYNAGKKAADKGAKYYHISRIAQDSKGPNRTIYVDLYR